VKEAAQGPQRPRREKKNKGKRAQTEILSQTMVSLGSTFILRGERKQFLYIHFVRREKNDSMNCYMP
jgi:hypothetical protein